MNIPNEWKNARLQTALEDLDFETADLLIKGLRGDAPYTPLWCFQIAFHDEIKEGLANRRAVPERTYYAALVNGDPYLLLGVTKELKGNPTAIAISFARICPQSKNVALKCLRVLLECKLIHLCRSNGKDRIIARIVTSSSYKCLEGLCRDLPANIEREYFSEESCVLRLRG